MSGEHSPPERDELLESAALGRLDRSDPRVAERLRSDPELARAVAELERTRVTAERVLLEAKEMSARSHADATPADRTRVHEALTALARGRAGAGPGHRRGWFLALAGLAAALALIFLATRGPRTEPAGDQRLSDEPIEIQLVPGESCPGLRWRVELLAGESLELSFYADDGGSPGQLVLGPVPVDGEGWQPNEEQGRALPNAWIAELIRIDRDKDRHLLGRKRSSSPP